MRFLPTALPGVVLIEPDVLRDERGYFLETYHRERYFAGGIAVDFVQDNQSKSKARTLRGLHAQRGDHAQGKLVRAIEGEVFDVAVDIRVGSPTFGKWVGEILSDSNFRQLYVPPGFLHGFCVTSESAQIAYKCTSFYSRGGEIEVAWNDPDIGIDWPVADPLLSPKDAAARRLREILDLLPPFEAQP